MTIIDFILDNLEEDVDNFIQKHASFLLEGVHRTLRSTKGVQNEDILHPAQTY